MFVLWIFAVELFSESTMEDINMLWEGLSIRTFYTGISINPWILFLKEKPSNPYVRWMVMISYSIHLIGFDDNMIWSVSLFPEAFKNSKVECWIKVRSGEWVYTLYKLVEFVHKWLVRVVSNSCFIKNKKLNLKYHTHRLLCLV